MMYRQANGTVTNAPAGAFKLLRMWVTLTSVLCREHARSFGVSGHAETIVGISETDLCDACADSMRGVLR